MKLPVRMTILFILLLAFKHTNAQELPAYYVPNKSNGVTYRTNFCKLHASVERGEVELRNALEGLSITVGVFDYQLNQETGAIDEENPNIAFDFLDELSKRGKFNYRNSYGKVDSPGANETWADILFHTTDVYDVAGEWWTETTTRLERNIIYPDGWYDANLIMVEETGKSAEFDFASFAAPFTPGLWGLIALTTIVSGIVYYVLDYFDSRIKGRPMDMGLEASLFFTAFLMKGHYAHQPKTRSTRILVFSMAFFFFFVVACYTANLASFLVLKNRQVIINDIQDVIRNDMTFCVEKNTANEEYLQSFRIQPRNLVRTVSEGDVEFEGAAFLALLEGQCDVVLTAKGTFDKFKIRKKYNHNCNLDLVGRIQKMQSSGFAIKDSEQYCASIVRDVLHLHMLEMKEEGIYDMIWDNFLSKAATNSCDANAGSGEDDVNYDGLGIANLSGMFALHAIGLFIALGITLFNFCKQPKHKRKTMINELRRGMFGSTSLNRAVVFAANSRSSMFCLAKNNQTGTNSRASASSCVGGEIETVDKLNHSSSRPKDNPDEESAKNSNGQSGVGKDEDAEEEVNVPAKVENDNYSTRALLEKQNQVIESLLQQIQRMDERSRKMDERGEKMDERSLEMHSRIQEIEGKK